MRVTSFVKVEKPQENRDSRFQIQDSKIYQELITGCQYNRQGVDIEFPMQASEMRRYRVANASSKMR